MLTEEQFKEREDNLRFRIKRLCSGSAQCLEYGPTGPENENSFYSYLKLRLIPTAGGIQFCLKILSGGVEGSGIYTHDAEDAIQMSMKLIRKYHKPSPIHQIMSPDMHAKIEQRAAECDWFETNAEPGKYHQAALERTADPHLTEMFPGLKTINLE